MTKPNMNDLQERITWITLTNRKKLNKSESADRDASFVLIATVMTWTWTEIAEEVAHIVLEDT